jgi:hypothetical protein
MARDALDPGPLGNYPNWPRRPDGSPDPARMPTGMHKQRLKNGDVVDVDLTPRDPSGEPIVPPTIPPETESE